jgi:hypothetical protein
MRVHRNFGMGMRTEQPCTLSTKGAIAKRRTFSGAGNNADVEGHVLDETYPG